MGDASRIRGDNGEEDGTDQEENLICVPTATLGRILCETYLVWAMQLVKRKMV